MPVPYDLEIKLNVGVSNTDQQFQILEQILPLFDPQLQIQSSDAPFDLTRITSIELINGPSFDQNILAAADTRILQSTLTFKMPIWIGIPADIRHDFVNQIVMRVGAVNNSTALSTPTTNSITNSNTVLAALDNAYTPFKITISPTGVPF
jgi:hypothetical protein